MTSKPNEKSDNYLIFKLRPLQLDDLDAVIEIDRLSLPTPTKKGIYQYELVQNQLAHYRVLVVEGNGRTSELIGFAGFWLMGDEIHVSMIAVHPAWRRKRLGERLLADLLEQAKATQAVLVTLEVREHNTAAQSLYHKYKFEVVGRRKRYYKDTGEDAILMTLFLT